MATSDSNLRATANQGEAGRLADVDRDIQMGEFLNAMINGMTATETGVSVTSNVATLAGTPVVLWDANGTAGTTTGHKQVLKVSAAYLTANNPAAGTCYWNGSTSVKFSSVDAISTAAFKYPKAADVTCSYLQRTLGEVDG
jgi:hypothetical protein